MKRTAFLLLVLGCVSCSVKPIEEEQDPKPYKESILEFSATVKPLTDSKSYISPDNKFYWELNDQIGFWPDDANVLFGQPSQVVFHVSKIQESETKFTGNGWGIARGTTYHSYYPYDPDATKDCVTIKYSGQNPSQSGNTDHLGAYDYLYSTSTVPVSGPYTIEYSRIGTIARFLITIPEEYRTCNFTYLVLSSAENLFTESVEYNPSQNPIQFSNQSLKNYLTIKLGNSAGMPCDSLGKLEIYSMMFPTAWADKDISVLLQDSDAFYYSGSFHTKSNQQANKRYLYKVENLESAAETDLSPTESANCYIVSEKGKYKFKAVEGNTQTQVNAQGVKVLWESDNTSVAPAVGSLINPSVSISDGYIHFRTNGTFKKGNAVIAAYSDSACSEGKVLWSWHIWLTDTPENQEYCFDAGYLMDRNLGALSTTGNLSAGLLYQWGRKDPFLGTASLSSAVAVKATRTFDKVARTSSNGTVAWATAHPTSFIYCNVSPLDWKYSQDGSLWRNADSSKTKYDPCPPGYKVIRGSTTANTEAGRGFWATALGFNWRVTSTDNTFTTPAGTVALVNNMMTFPLVEGVSNYPAVGCLTDAAGALQHIGNVMMWADYPAGSDDNKNWNTQYSGVLDLNPTSHKLTVNWNSGRAAGKSVRCMIGNLPTQSFSPNEGFSEPVHHEW